MKFGIFLPNGTNGYILSKNAPRYEPTFEHNKAITLEAEKQGLDFVLSMIKYRGFGGEIGYWDSCLESMTLSAGLLTASTDIRVIGTVGILSQHPAVVARMAATLDEMSGGRFGLNIVTGWNKPEYAQMGIWPGDEHYGNRYQYAREYVEILKDLWDDGQCDFKGEYFTLEDCRCYPTPNGGSVQLVCAGQSENGLKFTAEYANRNFVGVPPNQLADIAAKTKSLASAANNDVGTYALLGMVIAETDEQAQAQAKDIVAGADMEAIANVVGSANLDTKGGGTVDVLKAGLDKPLEEGNMAFMGFPALVGGYDTLADRIRKIRDTTEVDGILFTFPDFVDGIRQFGENVMPRL